MMLKTKLLVPLSFFSTTVLYSQNDFRTNGLFEFVDSLHIPASYLISPGQVTKEGNIFLMGLTSGDLEDMADLNSNLFAIDLTKEPAGGAAMKNLNIPNQVDQYRFYQCSASEGEKVIVLVVNDGGGWSDNDLGIAIMDSAGNYPNMYYLTNLNDDVTSDAYPWLSADGLRLYYSRDFKLMYAERKNINDEFSDPVEVDFTGDVQLDIISTWLSPDELKMYFIANNMIYLSTRKNKSEQFSFPEIYTTEFKDFYFIAGLSFTPDRKNMFLYYSDEQTEKILMYHLKKGKI